MRMMSPLVGGKKKQEKKVRSWDERGEFFIWAVWSEKKNNESDDRQRQRAFVRLSCPNLKMPLMLCVT